GETSTYSASFGATALYGMVLERDALGRVTTKSETIGGATHVISYSYDGSGRVVEVRQDGGVTESYAYDPNGNRLSGTYDAQDRLTLYGGATYANSAAGERTTKTLAGQTTAYRYDSLGNLTGATLADGQRIDYVLDGTNRRVGRRVNGTLRQGWL